MAARTIHKNEDDADGQRDPEEDVGSLGLLVRLDHVTDGDGAAHFRGGDDREDAGRQEEQQGEDRTAHARGNAWVRRLRRRHCGRRELRPGRLVARRLRLRRREHARFRLPGRSGLHFGQGGVDVLGYRVVEIPPARDRLEQLDRADALFRVLQRPPQARHQRRLLVLGECLGPGLLAQRDEIRQRHTGRRRQRIGQRRRVRAAAQRPGQRKGVLRARAAVVDALREREIGGQQ